MHDILNSIERNSCKTFLVNDPPRIKPVSVNTSVIHENRDSHRAQEKIDLGFVEEMIFDQKLRFIIGYGKNMFMIYNIA